MKISTKSRNCVIAAALAAVAASASAVEATQDFEGQVLSTRSRAEVLAELAVVRTAGQPEQRGEAYGGFSPREIASTLSRAEVIADLQLWRESGLAELSHGAAGPDTFSARYRQAQARYAALRASPRYAQLVQQIAEQRGEVPAGVSVAARGR